jgi:ATP-binding cassette, subfamily B (MDR/TAP), member 1
MKVFGMMLIAVLGFSMFFGVFQEIGKARTAANKIIAVIKRKPMMEFMDGSFPNTNLKGNIIMKNVNFSYPTRPNIVVMKNFNLTIEPGQQVALVGPSGSGKSTTVSLLEKFYEPDSGEIIIDGHNLKDLSPQYLHKQIGIVTQEPVLFAMTIKENIMYSVDPKNVSDSDIFEAAKKANAHEFIMKLPKKYETQIGERGSNISGGQKQRIAIARAVLQNPNILLLDEATSALDSGSEHIVQDALNKLMQGRTTIIIAHRLTTIKDVDKIVVIEHGEIKEMGTHDELLANEDGVYHKLASRQMMYNDKIENKEKETEQPTQYVEPIALIKE